MKTPSKIDELAQSIAAEINTLIEEAMPEFSDPFVILNDSEKPGLYISVVDGDDTQDTAQVLPWDKFEEYVLLADPDQLSDYIPRFESLIEKMRRAVAEDAR